MRLICFERLRLWGIGALMLLLVHGLCLTRTAQAHCSRLVTSQSQRLHDFNRLGVLIAGDSSALNLADLAQSPQEVEPKKQPAPCSGPGCSSQDSKPVSTGAPDTDRHDRWGDLSIERIIPITSRPYLTLDGPANRPTGHKPSIFHPPPL